MANIVDLTNSTWKFIESFAGYESQYIEINVNFTSNDFEYTKIALEPGTGLIYIKNGNPTVVHPITDGVGVWVNEEARTIVITGGEDVTNSTAIADLKGLAVYISGGVKDEEEPDTPAEPDDPTEDLEYKTVGALLTGIADSIRIKKGTTDEINAQKMPKQILSIETGVQEISTEQEMNALLIADNVGKVYRFVGVTGAYVNGDLYEVVSE